MSGWGWNWFGFGKAEEPPAAAPSPGAPVGKAYLSPLPSFDSTSSLPASQASPALKVGGSTQVKSASQTKICGDYSVVKTLGKGSYGIVALVDSPDGRRLAAKKSLVSGTSSFGEVIPAKDFIAEVDMLMRFNHPNVMTAEDYFLSGGESCAILPVAEMDLEHYRSSIGEVNFRKGAEVAEGCCRGLAYLHANGVIHRDLKLGNILMVNGKPKLADFGMCVTLASVTDTIAYTSPVGTAWWRAPELFYHPRDGTYRYGLETDVWSMLLIVAELIYAQEPAGMDVGKQKGSRAENLLEAINSFWKRGGYVPANLAKKATVRRETVAESIRGYFASDLTPRDLVLVEYLSDAMLQPPRSRPTAQDLTEKLDEYLVRKPLAPVPKAFAPAEVAYHRAFNPESRAEQVTLFREFFAQSPRAILLSIDIFDRASTALNDTPQDIQLNAAVATYLTCCVLNLDYDDYLYFGKGFGPQLEKVLAALKFHIYRPDATQTMGLDFETAIELVSENLSIESYRAPAKRAPAKRAPAKRGARKVVLVEEDQPVRKPVTKRAARRRGVVSSASAENLDASPRRRAPPRARK